MSREVCGICWCPYDDITGDCACPPSNVQKSTLRQAAQQALEALEGKRFTACGWRADCDKAITTLRAALAEPVQEPMAWSHNLIDNIITHRPADLKRHPERWTALYSEPQPCPTCASLEAQNTELDRKLAELERINDLHKNPHSL